MADLTPNLQLSSQYLRENVISWGVAPEQCKGYIREDGKTFYLFIDKSRGLNSSLVSLNIRGRALREQPDGIYTWIYFLNNKGKYRLESSHVRSPSELGTKHINLLLRADPYLKTLLLSGELEKRGEDYRVNFYSGSTNMQELPDQDRLGQEFIYRLRRLLRLGKKAKVDFVTSPLEISSLVTDRETLLDYEEHGYQLLFFESAETCREYRQYLIRVFSLERNQELYQRALEAVQARGDTEGIKKYTSLLGKIEEDLDKRPVPFASSVSELYE